MNHPTLLIPTDTPKAKRKVIAKRSPKNFSLGLDELTHMTLVELQKAMSTPKLAPSRTLVTRRAIRLYGQEVRARLSRGDQDWLDAESVSLTGMSYRCPK